MGRIRGILFDKDGTLLDFHSLWVPVAERLVEEIIIQVKNEKDHNLFNLLLTELGVDVATKKVDPYGVLAGGTLEELAEKISGVLYRRKEVNREEANKITRQIDEEGYRILPLLQASIKPTTDLAKLFSVLQEEGFRLGLATTDTLPSTLFCLEKLSISGYLNFIGADDGLFLPKPDPALLWAFCSRCGITPEEVAVVGDSPFDMEFARRGRAALAVGVLSGVGDERLLAPVADIILPHVGCLLDAKGRPIERLKANK